MDHNSYPMKKLGNNTNDYGGTKSNNCSSYVRFCLLCTSTIQMLIILGLVLFMIYGNNYNNHQLHLKSTQNQSVKFIEDINQLQHKLTTEKKNLQNCRYISANRTEKLKNITKSLQTCIINTNISKQLNNLQFFPYFQGISGTDFNTLLRNYSISQNELSKLRADHELKEAKHMLEETRLNSQNKYLSKQLGYLKENCTFMSKDFQTAINKAQASYEESFRSLTTGVGLHNLGWNSQLERIKANCTPLSLRFQTEIQHKLVQLDTTIKRMWSVNEEQRLQVGTLQRMNNDCKQDAAKKFDQFTKRESEMQKDMENYMAERVKLLEERNFLRTQLALLKDRNPLSNILLSQIGLNPSASSCQQQAMALAQMKLLLEMKSNSLAGKEQEVENLKLQLKEQKISCSIQSELQKQAGCRASGQTV